MVGIGSEINVFNQWRRWSHAMHSYFTGNSDEMLIQALKFFNRFI